MTTSTNNCNCNQQPQQQPRMCSQRQSRSSTTTVLRTINDNSIMVDQSNELSDMQQQQQPQQSILLDRLAILKAFSATTNTVDNQSYKNGSKYEKSTTTTTATTPTARAQSFALGQQKRRKHLKARQQQHVLNRKQYNKAIEKEFERLKDSVPSIAGKTNVPDLTIINEAITLICDLESKLLQKFQNKLIDYSSISELRQQQFNMK